MITAIDELITNYAAWLRDKTVLKQIKDWVEITTPYLDRHNDYLQIYVQKKGDCFVLTDDSYTIEDLVMSGCKLDTRKRKELLDITLRGFGVTRKDDQLTIEARAQDFPLKKHSLIQSMLAVNDMFFLASPTIVSIFLEDVTSWLDQSEIRYTPSVKFTGKSGYDHQFEFVIPKSPKQPERVLKIFNRPGRDTAQTMAFSWLDIKNVRPQDAVSYAILNNESQAIPGAVIEALKSYDIMPVLWTERESQVKALAN
jgi:hypothetical protein